MDRLRWEGFSACCSVYARVDLLPPALDGVLLAQGTTNVDLGSAAQAAVSQLGDRCRLSIGVRQLEIESDAGQVVERKLLLEALAGPADAVAHPEKST